VLAAISAVIGFGSPYFAQFLGHEGEWPSAPIALTSTAVAGLGLALGWWAYGRRTKVLNTRPLKERAGFVYGALTMKLYFDITYDFFIVRGYGLLADALAVFDTVVVDGVVNGAGALWRAGAQAGALIDRYVIDGAVNGTATLVRAAGAKVRRIQVGRIQAYQGLMVGAIVLLMLWFVVKGA